LDDEHQGVDHGSDSEVDDSPDVTIEDETIWKYLNDQKLTGKDCECTEIRTKY